jgi:hypothetical protein
MFEGFTKLLIAKFRPTKGASCVTRYLLEGIWETFKLQFDLAGASKQVAKTRMAQAKKDLSSKDELKDLGIFHPRCFEKRCDKWRLQPFVTLKHLAKQYMSSEMIAKCEAMRIAHAPNFTHIGAGKLNSVLQENLRSSAQNEGHSTKREGASAGGSARKKRRVVEFSDESSSDNALMTDVSSINGSDEESD